MVEEHRRCALLLTAAEEALARCGWAAFSEHIRTLRDALLAHFAAEEEFIFPRFEGSLGLRQPTWQLRMQHQRMREIVETLASVSPAHDPEGCGAELVTLATLYRQHCEAEEDGMYPALGNSLPCEPLPPAAPSALDLRGLEPPQPMVRIFEELKRAPGEPLKVVLPHEPHPLYGLLREQGFAWSGAPRADGGFELTIRRA